MLRLPIDRMLSLLDAALAALGNGFLRVWSRVERGYRRPLARFSMWLEFAFYPLLAIGAIEYFRARNEGGWPWSRQRHAELLDQTRANPARAIIEATESTAIRELEIAIRVMEPPR